MARHGSLLRQWQLLKRLQTARYGLGIDEICSALECSRRTVQRDLAMLRIVFPLDCIRDDTGRKHWRLGGGFIEAEPLQLSLTETISLHVSRQLFAPLTGTPFGDGLGTALQKIRAQLPNEALEYFSGLDGAFLVKSMGLEDYSAFGTIIAAINEAVLHEKVLRIGYHSVSRDREVDSEFHPYGLVLVGASLYCIGYLQADEAVRTLKVSRFRRAQVLAKEFSKPSDFSLAEHTADAFGIYTSGEPQTVRARFTGWAATNVREHCWHPTQRICEDTPEAMVVEFELSSTVEFKRWLLGFGRHAEVEEPASLREELCREIHAMRELYEG